MVLDVEESRFDLYAHVRAVDDGKLTQILLVPNSSDLGGLLRALQWWFKHQSRPVRVPFRALVLEDRARLVKVSEPSNPLVSATAAAASACVCVSCITGTSHCVEGFRLPWPERRGERATLGRVQPAVHSGRHSGRGL